MGNGVVDRFLHIYWSKRWIRIFFAIFQVIFVTLFSFCIQCHLEGIPIFTEISFTDVLLYIMDYYLKELKWLKFRIGYWRHFNASGHLVTPIPASIPRMA